jgi:hypothetical protein
MLSSDNSYFYILGDGNNIRDRVDHLLLNDDLEALKNVSQCIINAINAMKDYAVSKMDAEIIIAGGDDIFFRMKRSDYRKTDVNILASIFQDMTGCTFSFGIGETVEDAFVDLRRAKASSSFTKKTIL